MPAEGLVQQRHQTDNPAMKCGMVNSNAAFSHHFLEIAQAKSISQISTNTLRDDIDGIMQAFKGISEQRH
jgi:hypothetical protein